MIRAGLLSKHTRAKDQLSSTSLPCCSSKLSSLKDHNSSPADQSLKGQQHGLCHCFRWPVDEPQRLALLLRGPLSQNMHHNTQVPPQKRCWRFLQRSLYIVDSLLHVMENSCNSLWPHPCKPQNPGTPSCFLLQTKKHDYQQIILSDLKGCWWGCGFDSQAMKEKGIASNTIETKMYLQWQLRMSKKNTHTAFLDV